MGAGEVTGGKESQNPTQPPAETAPPSAILTSPWGRCPLQQEASPLPESPTSTRKQALEAQSERPGPGWEDQTLSIEELIHQRGESCRQNREGMRH